VGGDFDRSDKSNKWPDGAAWVFTRNGGTWTQQGSKLVGSGAAGGAWQGHSVALSADGNTAIVGGYGDTDYLGAAWVFTRSTAGVWTQQGSKLVGLGAVGKASQGWSVALSADGNTAIVGGYRDTDDLGAAWVFTRSAGVWTQQGNKLRGTGVVNEQERPTIGGPDKGGAEQGWSVALSADGNTAIVGGTFDNLRTGAAWVFTRKDDVWTQQGSKLVGTGSDRESMQGWSVALTADGSTAIVGGPHDNDLAGAAWVFTRKDGVWTQLGNKLVGSGCGVDRVRRCQRRIARRCCRTFG
jgi:hypothetical protein